jgi:signal transduction histidine kinase
MGVVVLTASDLTRPIRKLERSVAAIARGELSRAPEPIAVEADEVGRLYHAFKEMRQALLDRFRSSEEMNVALDAQVKRRTAELLRRNRELEEAMQELQRAQKELLDAEKMASMGRLVAGIAHEINNPVNAVVNTCGPLSESLSELSERVQREQDDAAMRRALLQAVRDMRDMLRVLSRGALRTREIVHALHNYSRGDSGVVTQVDLERCLDESLDLLQHDLKAGIRVIKDYGGIEPVTGHAGQLQQVFMNLLNNAVHALTQPARDPAHGTLKAAPTIRITTRTEGDRVVVQIADNGPGIPKEVLPRIFDPFFTTKDVGQGSGLGLSIVHSIIERHGGTVTAESAPAQGARFEVALPWVPRAQEKDQVPPKKDANSP